MTLQVDLKFDDPAFVEETEIDRCYCWMVTPTKFGGSRQMPDVHFICYVSFFLLSFCISQFDLDEVDFIKVAWHFRPKSIKHVNDVRD